MQDLNSQDPRIHWIKKQLTQLLQPSFLEVIDQGWQHIGHREEGAGHFLVRIASPKFNAQSLLDCHRLVNNALIDKIGKNIHALQIDIQR